MGKKKLVRTDCLGGTPTLPLTQTLLLCPPTSWKLSNSEHHGQSHLGTLRYRRGGYVPSRSCRSSRANWNLTALAADVAFPRSSNCFHAHNFHEAENGHEALVGLGSLAGAPLCTLIHI